MDRKLNLGIMATGAIAQKVVLTLNRLECLNVYAVCSRTQEKADEFASQFNVQKAYGTYEDMLKDPLVDLVYITTPHSEHLKYIKLCAQYGKNYICEKAFTLNAKEAEEAIQLTKKAGIFGTEAIWCRYAPMAKTIKDFIESGKLGDVISITANLGYPVWHRERLHKRELGGGALLDVGIYCLNFLDLVTGGDEFDTINVNACIDKTYKTDKYEKVDIKYRSGITASIFNSIINCTDRYGAVYGTKGTLYIENINTYTAMTFYNNNREIEDTVYPPEMISGYEYEFEQACRCILEGKKESYSCNFEQTLRLMRQMDMIRKQMGVTYPCEE